MFKLLFLNQSAYLKTMTLSLIKIETIQKCHMTKKTSNL